MKKTVCLDFDGVINPYSKGWQQGVLYEKNVVPGFFEWADKMMTSDDIHLVIYSSRSKDSVMVMQMREWLQECFNQWRWQTTKTPNWTINDIEFAHEKPPAWLTIDDRAVQFQGTWDDPALSLESIANFKSWNQRNA